MTETCPNCGLPEDLCVCKDIAREEQQIEVSVSERRFGKKVTLVKGFDDEEVDIDDLETDLKKNLACGGTVKEGVIELQGDHRRRIKDVLEDLGFEKDAIEVH
ncbi:MAG: stress response translation initiation inhibitor YciH [Candidatus Nanohaloarchaeota archaeon QJJ-7]|nr:stress response translation initiation inhibitor YciH [Candidatus Nanohaloarchaeota archaeon QJJ-7]